MSVQMFKTGIVSVIFIKIGVDKAFQEVMPNILIKLIY